VGWIASKWVHALVLRVARRSKIDEALEAAEIEIPLDQIVAHQAA
jgi:hypothetical protein